MNSTRSYVALVTGALMLSSCATIVNGRTQPVTVMSEPPGAQVKIDNIPVGTTPTTMELKRGDVHQVTIEKDGYVLDNEAVSQSTSGWFAGNILLGGIVGMIVDYSTGAMYNLNPTNISPALVKAAEPATPPLAAAQPAAAPSPLASANTASPPDPSKAEIAPAAENNSPNSASGK